jgi:hypothetical protein
VTRPDEPIFYIDESIASKILIRDLRRMGADIRCVGEILPRGSPDEEWLRKCGENGWTAIFRDKKIRYRKIEKDALLEFGVGAFGFTAGQATGRQTADRIISLLPQFKQRILDEPRPFLFTFGLAGPIARVRLMKSADSTSPGLFER